MTAATRRSVLGGVLRLGAIALGASAIARALDGPAWADEGWHSVDVTGSAPPLAFTMIDAASGKEVTAHDFRGKVVMLTLGYTQCPDICPLTLGRMSEVLTALSGDADGVCVLFVTVDPDRDTLPMLRQYAAAFAPQIVRLRGSPDQIVRLSHRFRLAYTVSPASAGRPYEVTHSTAVYVFDATGAARLLVPSLASQSPDIDGTVENSRRLLRSTQLGWWSRVMSEL